VRRRQPQLTGTTRRHHPTEVVFNRYDVTSGIRHAA
jgi:hypothetical protein